MKIEIRLFATFRDNRFKTKTIDIDIDSTVNNILEELDILESDVAILLINGRDGKFDSVLKENDRVSLFPPVGGG